MSRALQVVVMLIGISGCAGRTAVYNEIDREVRTGLYLDVLGVRDVSNSARSAGREIQLRLRNRTQSTIQYVGSSEDTPIIRVAQSSLIGWRSDNSPGCGTGENTYELESGMELSFTVWLPRDATNERIRISVFNPQNGERIWSPSIDLDHRFWADAR